MRGRDDDRLAGTAVAPAAAHRGADAARLRLVAGGQHDAAADDHRPPAQARIVTLLDRRVERVEVGVQDRRLAPATNICSHRPMRLRRRLDLGVVAAGGERAGDPGGDRDHGDAGPHRVVAESAPHLQAAERRERPGDRPGRAERRPCTRRGCRRGRWPRRPPATSGSRASRRRRRGRSRPRPSAPSPRASATGTARPSSAWRSPASSRP